MEDISFWLYVVGGIIYTIVSALRNRRKAQNPQEPATRRVRPRGRPSFDPDPLSEPDTRQEAKRRAEEGREELDEMMRRIDERFGRRPDRPAPDEEYEEEDDEVVTNYDRQIPDEEVVAGDEEERYAKCQQTAFQPAAYRPIRGKLSAKPLRPKQRQSKSVQRNESAAIVRLLRSRQGVRQAIIMKEIFDRKH